jgi:hypothetical protein
MFDGNKLSNINKTTFWGKKWGWGVLLFAAAVLYASGSNDIACRGSSVHLSSSQELLKQR